MKNLLNWILNKRHVHPSTEFPKRDVDKNGKPRDLSVDVFAKDIDDLYYVAYYNHELKEWGFLTTLLSEECVKEFVWMYPPSHLTL